jgi:hypothetical protein
MSPCPECKYTSEERHETCGQFFQCLYTVSQPKQRALTKALRSAEMTMFAITPYATQNVPAPCTVYKRIVIRLIRAPTWNAGTLKDPREQKSDKRILNCQTDVGTEVQGHIEGASSKHACSISGNRWCHIRNGKIRSDREIHMRYRGMEFVSGNDQHRVVEEIVQRAGSYQEDHVSSLSSRKYGVFPCNGSGWIS